MSEPTKKQTFLHGAALLAIATAIVKVIGALYKIPLKMIIGDQGYGYFCTAYDIYSVLLLISTAGLPVAVSRMVSQTSSLGNYNQTRKVYSTAQTIFIVLGLVSSFLMMAFGRQLAAFQKQPNAYASIVFLGPCAFLMCMMSAYRGFSQGLGDMRPTSVSQVLEAVIKLVVGLAAALLILNYTASIPLAAGGAILGVTASCLVSTLYLSNRFRKVYKDLPASADTPETFGATTKKLLAIAVPITIGSAGLQILTVLETNLFMSQLLATGSTQEQADIMKGVYNMTQTIFNLPCAFIVPITVSIIPAVTSNLTLGKNKAVKETEESACRITGLISLPCAVGLAVLSRPIMALLGDYEGARLDLATQLMSVLGIVVFLYATVQLTNALMQAHGYAHLPVINMLLCGVMKLAIVYMLVGNANIGLAGAPLGAIIGYLAICVLNLVAMRRVVPQKPAVVKNLLRALIPALVMGAAAYGSYRGLAALMGEGGSRLILCAVPVAVGMVVYVTAAVMCKSITREDCLLLPKGEKIAKLLHL